MILYILNWHLVVFLNHRKHFRTLNVEKKSIHHHKWHILNRGKSKRKRRGIYFSLFALPLCHSLWLRIYCCACIQKRWIRNFLFFIWNMFILPFRWRVEVTLTEWEERECEKKRKINHFGHLEIRFLVRFGSVFIVVFLFGSSLFFFISNKNCTAKIIVKLVEFREIILISHRKTLRRCKVFFLSFRSMTYNAIILWIKTNYNQKYKQKQWR